MTKLEFWRTLKSLAGDNWLLVRQALDIRLDVGGLRICPVCAVANAILGERSLFHTCWREAAKAVGLDQEYALLIAYASDCNFYTRNVPSHRVSTVRELIKRTLGLV